MLRGLQADPPRDPPEVLHRRRDRVLRRSLRQDRRAGAARAAGGGARFAAGRRRRDLRRARAQEDLRRQVRRRSLPGDPSPGAPARHADERHDALRPHRDGRGARSITCCARARCRTRPAGCRRSSRWRSIPTTTRCGSCRRRARSRRCACTPSSRLMLDNVPHIKAFWIATGVETAQLALWFGADDLDGTVQEEHIYHMAGSRTPEGMTTKAIRRLIREAGREPYERDTLYNVITGPDAGLQVQRITSSERATSHATGRRIGRDVGQPLDYGHQTAHPGREAEHRRAPAAPRAVSASVRRRDGRAASPRRSARSASASSSSAITTSATR